MTDVEVVAPGSAGGGPARRAVVRWAVRLLRRDWRQQVLVFLLLVVATTAAVGFGTVGYTLAPVPGDAEFGSATHLLQFFGPNVAEDVAAAGEWFDTVEVVGHRGVPVPGRFEPIDHRAQDPDGPFGTPMLALLDGRYPSGDEVAVSDEVADDLDLAIGGTLALDGTSRRVVGVVENPSDLTDEFVLLSPTHASDLEAATVLVDAPEERVRAFRPPGDGGWVTSSRSGRDEAAVVAVGILGLTTIALVLVGLLASAGFVVMARRRRRDLGMLSAIGATERHLRLALVANGAALGLTAATAGALLGISAWILAHPWLESAVGFRVARFDLPWWLIGVIVLLATTAATAAAWWPSRLVSQVSTMRALSGRPDRPSPVHRSAVTAGVLVGAGVPALALSGPVVDEQATRWSDVALLLGGTTAVVAGLLMLSPLAIRAAAWPAARLPIAGRVALRDLARYQSRSSAALAALTVVLGIPVAIVISASAGQHTAEAGNLADDQLLLRGAEYGGPFVPERTDLVELQQGVDAIADHLPTDTVTDLRVAIDPRVVSQPEFRGLPAATLAARSEDGWVDLSLLYVASPELLALHGLEEPGPDTEILTTESGELTIVDGVLSGEAPGRDVLDDLEPLTSPFSSLPSTLITTRAMADRGLAPISSGQWLLETDRPLTDEERATTRELAAANGLTIETRDHQLGLIRLRTGATVAGVLLALGVLAMTVGLIRNEADADLRTLTAIGATNAVRRSITAATAGALAVLGGLLGAVGAVAVLASGYLDIASAITRLPAIQTALIMLGTPVVATLGGWLLAGPEPTTTGRQPIA